jgi:hypothetical protein
MFSANTAAAVERINMDSSEQLQYCIPAIRLFEGFLFDATVL